MTTQVLASAVRSTFLAGVLGLLAFPDGNPFIQTGINSTPQAVNVQTITVAGSPTSSHEFIVTINGIDCSYTSDASATSAEVVAGLVAAINNEPGVRATVRAVATSSTVVTVTGITPGVTFTMSDADSDLTCAVSTAAESADAIEFGRLVCSAASLDSTLHLPSVFKPLSTYLTAQVDSWAITYDAGITITVQVVVDDVPYAVTSAVMATDIDTVIDALVVLVNGTVMGLPANSVIATANAASATALVLTSEVPGKAFTSSITFSTGADTAAAALTRTAPGTSDVSKSMRGITTMHGDTQATTIGGGTTSYAANEGVNFCTNGCVWVASTEAVTPDSDVYVETSGASAGLFYTTTSATRIKLPRTRFQWGQAQASDGIAQLRIFKL